MSTGGAAKPRGRQDRRGTPGRASRSEGQQLEEVLTSTKMKELVMSHITCSCLSFHLVTTNSSGCSILDGEGGTFVAPRGARRVLRANN